MFKHSINISYIERKRITKKRSVKGPFLDFFQLYHNYQNNRSSSAYVVYVVKTNEIAGYSFPKTVRVF